MNYQIVLWILAFVVIIYGLSYWMAWLEERKTVALRQHGFNFANQLWDSGTRDLPSMLMWSEPMGKAFQEGVIEFYELMENL